LTTQRVMIKCISIKLNEEETRKQMSQRFSKFVLEHKRVKHYETLFETIQDITDNSLFPEVDEYNVGKFIDESLRDKLLIECSKRAMIKDEFVSRKTRALISL